MDEYQLGKDIQTLKDFMTRLNERIDLIEKKSKCKESRIIGTFEEKVEYERGRFSKSLSWDPLHSGDCTLTNAIITMYDNGTVSFSATIHTDHSISGDVWHAGITLMDSDLHPIVALDEIHSPTVGHNDPSTKTWYYSWNGRVFPLIKDNFNKINNANMNYSC